MIESLLSFATGIFRLIGPIGKRALTQLINHFAIFNPILPPANTWEEQSQYQFILSPHGAGIDCFRTWEALVLGCIPIVKKSHISELFQDLPVIAVES